jgi:hypothetical protein
MYLLLFVIARKDARILFTYSLVYTYLLFGFVIVIIVWCFVYIFICFFDDLIDCRLIMESHELGETS